MSNLSNAPFSPPVQPPLASYSNQQIPNFNQYTGPNSLASENSTTPVSGQIGGAGILVYPKDPPKYIMTFSIQQYNRASYNQIGQYVASGYPGIALPLPDAMHNLNESSWSEQDSGLIQLAAAGLEVAAGGAASILGKIPAVGQLQKSATGIPGLGGLVAAGSEVVGTGLQAFAGATPNQFQVMLFRGPKYKQHDFTWTLSPQNFQEADIIRMICLTVQNAMAPTIATLGGFGLGRALWGFPCVFRCRVYPNARWLYKFKPMVCTQWLVNYTPTGKSSFLRNVNGFQGDNPPESITIQAKFMEMEYWVAGNYSNTDDPDDVDLGALNTEVNLTTGVTANAAPILASAGGGNIPKL